jgi:hypothetical protein
MNAEEAQRALSKGKVFLERGEKVLALKFLRISQRLSPSNEAGELIERILQEPAQSPTNQNTPAPDFFNSAQNIASDIKKRYLEVENRYIAPSMKNHIRLVFFIIIVLVIWKYIFKIKPRIGSLPGDISYQSQNVYISAPIVSCLLFSFFLSAVQRAFSC